MFANVLGYRRVRVCVCRSMWSSWTTYSAGKSSLCACEAEWNLTTSQFLSKYREGGNKEEGQTGTEGESMSNAVLTNPSVLPPPLDISCSPHLLLHLWLSSLLLHSPPLHLPPSPPFPILPSELPSMFLAPPHLWLTPHILFASLTAPLHFYPPSAPSPCPPPPSTLSVLLSLTLSGGTICALCWAVCVVCVAVCISGYSS